METTQMLQPLGERALVEGGVGAEEAVDRNKHILNHIMDFWKRLLGTLTLNRVF
jgi:hypothetical protein